MQRNAGNRMIEELANEVSTSVLLHVKLFYLNLPLHAQSWKRSFPIPEMNDLFPLVQRKLRFTQIVNFV